MHENFVLENTSAGPCLCCAGKGEDSKGSLFITQRLLSYLQQWLEKLQNVFLHAGASGMRGRIFSHSDGMGSANGSWSHMLCFELSDSLLIQK